MSPTNLHKWLGPLVDSFVPTDEEIIVDGSEDESSEEYVRRLARREEIGRKYLEGQVPIILTARLRGPFEKGWQNPWKRVGVRKDETVVEDSWIGNERAALEIEDSRVGRTSGTKTMSGFDTNVAEEQLLRPNMRQSAKHTEGRERPNETANQHREPLDTSIHDFSTLSFDASTDKGIKRRVEAGWLKGAQVSKKARWDTPERRPSPTPAPIPISQRKRREPIPRATHLRGSQRKSTSEKSMSRDASDATSSRPQTANEADISVDLDGAPAELSGKFFSAVSKLNEEVDDSAMGEEQYAQNTGLSPINRIISAAEAQAMSLADKSKAKAEGLDPLEVEGQWRSAVKSREESRKRKRKSLRVSEVQKSTRSTKDKVASRRSISMVAPAKDNKDDAVRAKSFSPERQLLSSSPINVKEIDRSGLSPNEVFALSQASMLAKQAATEALQSQGSTPTENSKRDGIPGYDELSVLDLGVHQALSFSQVKRLSIQGAKSASSTPRRDSHGAESNGDDELAGDGLEQATPCLHQHTPPKLKGLSPPQIAPSSGFCERFQYRRRKSNRDSQSASGNTSLRESQSQVHDAQVEPSYISLPPSTAPASLGTSNILPMPEDILNSVLSNRRKSYATLQEDSNSATFEKSITASGPPEDVTLNEQGNESFQHGTGDDADTTESEPHAQVVRSPRFSQEETLQQAIADLDRESSQGDVTPADQPSTAAHVNSDGLTDESRKQQTTGVGSPSHDLVDKISTPPKSSELRSSSRGLERVALQRTSQSSRRKSTPHMYQPPSDIEFSSDDEDEDIPAKRPSQDKPSPGRTSLTPRNRASKSIETASTVGTPSTVGRRRPSQLDGIDEEQRLVEAPLLEKGQNETVPIGGAGKAHSIEDEPTVLNAVDEDDNQEVPNGSRILSIDRQPEVTMQNTTALSPLSSKVAMKEAVSAPLPPPQSPWGGIGIDSLPLLANTTHLTECGDIPIANSAAGATALAPLEQTSPYPSPNIERRPTLDLPFSTPPPVSEQNAATETPVAQSTPSHDMNSPSSENYIRPISDFVTPSPKKSVKKTRTFGPGLGIDFDKSFPNTQAFYEAQLQNPWMATERKRVSFGPLPGDDEEEEKEGEKNPSKIRGRAGTPPPVGGLTQNFDNEEGDERVGKGADELARAGLKKGHLGTAYPPSQSQSSETGAMARAFIEADKSVGLQRHLVGLREEAALQRGVAEPRGADSDAGHRNGLETRFFDASFGFAFEEPADDVVQMGEFLQGWDVESAMREVSGFGS
jgi:hypothetical protein